MSESLAPARASEPPVYMTVEEVAGMLKVSRKSLYRWVADDLTMPALRIGGTTIRFPRERLLRWLRDREQGPGRPGKRVRRPRTTNDITNDITNDTTNDTKNDTKLRKES